MHFKHDYFCIKKLVTSLCLNGILVGGDCCGKSVRDLYSTLSGIVIVRLREGSELNCCDGDIE